MDQLKEFRDSLNDFIDGVYRDEKKILVHGEGRMHARVMLIGEAPGEQETLLGRPFVGKAGKNLDEFLKLAGLNREELYVSNTVKFRPTKISAAGRTINRPPTWQEIDLFLPWLKKEIDLVNPSCVVTLGNVPLKALTEKSQTIGEVHGRFLQGDGFILYPMYHPASMIYNPSLRSVYREDIERLAQWISNTKVN